MKPIRQILLKTSLIALLGVACEQSDKSVTSGSLDRQNFQSYETVVNNPKDLTNAYVLTNGMLIPKSRSILEKNGIQRIFKIDVGIKNYFLTVHDNGDGKPYWDADQGIMTIDEQGNLDESKLAKVPEYNLAKGHCAKGHLIPVWDLADESDPCYSERKK